jgi:hypothetical protein
MLRVGFTSIFLIVNISIAIFLPISPTPGTVQAYWYSTLLSVSYCGFFLMPNILRMGIRKKPIIHHVCELMVYIFILSWQYTVLIQFHKKLKKANHNECWSKQKWNKETKPLKKALYGLIVVQVLIVLICLFEKLPMQVRGIIDNVVMPHLVSEASVHFNFSDSDNTSVSHYSDDDIPDDIADAYRIRSLHGSEHLIAQFSSAKITITASKGMRHLSDEGEDTWFAKNKQNAGPIYLKDGRYIYLKDIFWNKVTKTFNPDNPTYNIPVKIKCPWITHSSFIPKKIKAQLELNEDDTAAFFKFVHKLPENKKKRLLQTEEDENNKGLYLTKFFEWLVVCKNSLEADKIPWENVEADSIPWGNVEADKKLTNAKMLKKIFLKIDNLDDHHEFLVTDTEFEANDLLPTTTGCIFQFFKTDYYITSIDTYDINKKIPYAHVIIIKGEKNAIDYVTKSFEMQSERNYTIFFGETNELHSFLNFCKEINDSEYIYDSIEEEEEEQKVPM